MRPTVHRCPCASFLTDHASHSALAPSALSTRFREPAAIAALHSLSSCTVCMLQVLALRTDLPKDELKELFEGMDPPGA